MTLSLRDIVRVRYGITGNFSLLKDVLSRARHDFGEGIARTANGNVSLQLLLLALRVTPPDSPTAVTASAGDSQITVTWQPPLSDGGSPIRHYLIIGLKAKGGFSTNQFKTDSNARSWVITGLTNGVPYFAAVGAENDFGSSWNVGSNVVTPEAPTATLQGWYEFDTVGTEPFSLTVPFSGQMQVASGSNGQTSFQVTGTAQNIIPNGPATVPFSVSGLRPGTWTVTAGNNPVGAPVRCNNVQVPGTVKLSVAGGQGPHCSPF